MDKATSLPRIKTASHTIARGNSQCLSSCTVTDFRTRQQALDRESYSERGHKSLVCSRIEYAAKDAAHVPLPGQVAVNLAFYLSFAHSLKKGKLAQSVVPAYTSNAVAAVKFPWTMK